MQMFDLRVEILAILKVFLQYEVDSVYYVEFNIYRLIASESKIRWNCTKRKCRQKCAEARGLLFEAQVHHFLYSKVHRKYETWVLLG